MIDAGANKEAQDYIKRTPLHLAARNGHTELVKLLISAGANIEALNKNGKTPLQVAQSKPKKYVTTYPEIIKLLQEAAKSKAKSQPTALSSTTTEDSSTVNTQVPPKTIESSKLPLPIETPSKTKVAKLPSPRNTDFIINYSDIILGKKIGSGGFGDVHQGTWDAQHVAIKTLHIKNLSDESKNEFERETKVWSKLHHPNIVALFGITIPKIPSELYCMVMALKEQGSLWKLLHSSRKLNWNDRGQLALDIGSALKYLHSRNILHRDLKSLNVLVEQREGKLHATLTDFGLSIVKNETTTISKPTGPTAGTLLWMAPELLQGKKCTKKSDIWAYGMILCELASRKRPYADAHPSVITQLIIKGTTPAIPETTPAYLQGIINQCLSKLPNKRPTAAHLLTLLTNSADTELETAPITALLETMQPYDGRPIPSSITSNPSTGLLSTGSSRSSRPVSALKKRKKLLAEVMNLLNEVYAPEDAIDDEGIAQYRNGMLKVFADYQTKTKLTKDDETHLNQIKQDLLEELE